MIGEGVGYGFSVEVAKSMEEAEAEVRAALKAEGFGVLTEIDVRATMREKLDVDFPPYKILGACNPPLALRSLTAEPGVGLLLPCNVVLAAGNGSTEVSFMDPVAVLGLVDNPALAAVAREVAEKLRRVAASLRET